MRIIAQAFGWRMDLNIVEWFTLFHERPVFAFAAFGFLDAALALLAAMILVPYLRALFGKNRLLGASLLVADGLAPLLLFWSNRSAELYIISRGYFRSHHFEEKLPFMDAGREVLRQLAEPASAVNRLHGAASALFFATGLTFAVLMFRPDRRHRLGAVGNGLALAYFPLLRLAPRYAFIPAALSAPFLAAWYFLLAAEIVRGAKEGSRERAPRAK